MVFAWIVLSFLLFKFSPWWGIVLVGLVVGFARPGKLFLDLQLALVSGAVAMAMAFYSDGRHLGLISKRMSGLFSLPVPDLMFAMMFVLFFTTVLLALQSGRAARMWFKVSQ